jgi:hypothetical protein
MSTRALKPNKPLKVGMEVATPPSSTEATRRWPLELSGRAQAQAAEPAAQLPQAEQNLPAFLTVQSHRLEDALQKRQREAELDEL